MKTNEQLVALAMEMVKDDANAIIMFALPSYILARQLFDEAKQSEDEDAAFKHQSLEVTFKSGGRILFRWVTDETVNDWGGYQYSHAFVPLYLGPKCEALVKSKMRYSLKRVPKVPCGIYRPHCIERFEYLNYEG